MSFGRQTTQQSDNISSCFTSFSNTDSKLNWSEHLTEIFNNGFAHKLSSELTKKLAYRDKSHNAILSLSSDVGQKEERKILRKVKDDYAEIVA